MTFAEASAYALPFGKYRGRTLDVIAGTDAGLRYLDWLVGRDVSGPAGEALRAYLSDSTIKREVERVTEGDS